MEGVGLFSWIRSNPSPRFLDINFQRAQIPIMTQMADPVARKSHTACAAFPSTLNVFADKRDERGDLEGVELDCDLAASRMTRRLPETSKNDQSPT
jgi:hypothetical protein